MSSSPSSPLKSASLADRYSIRQKLGSGSVGAVYLASDKLSGRLVAVKVLRVERLIEGAKGRMEEEFRAIAGLEHPQVAKAYDFGYTESGGVPFYTREYIPGEPLPPGPPAAAPPEEFLRPILDLLDALDYAHDEGVLHLDLHPGNLIVAEDRRRGSVLIDFDPRLPDTLPLFARSGGSWSWAPPELIGNRHRSPATDLFLAGKLLLYRITGSTQGGAALPREVPGWGTRLTLELERIIEKALQPDPERRFASAAEFRAALHKALGDRARTRSPRALGCAITGREAELAEVEALLRAASSGGAGFICFAGKPGSGKTRILSECRLRAQLRGFKTVDVRFGRDPGAGPALVQALRRVEPARRPRESWLGALSPEHGGTPEERSRRAAEILLLEGGAPLALLLDDLELADGESLDLAAALAGECLRRGLGGIKGRGLALIAASSKEGALFPARLPVRRLRPLPAAAASELFRALARPLIVPDRVVKLALSEASGSPARLRKLAGFLRGEYGTAGSVPESVRLPDLSEFPEADWSRLSAFERRLASVLVIAGRSACREELGHALGARPEPVRRALRRLTAKGIVARRGSRYEISAPAEANRLLGPIADSRARRIHRRMARYFEARGQRNVGELERLARHLLAGKRPVAGMRAALEAARRLRQQGSFDRAVRLLELAAGAESDPKRCFALLEKMSAILEEAGDHEKAIAFLETWLESSGESGSDRELVRVKRRLGVNCHRAGMPKKALEIFAEIQELADPVADLEELIFVDSELAEIHIFMGSFPEAEEACRSGLERLERSGLAEPFRRRFEVMLRASLGHIELRRLSLRRASAELEEALRLSRRYGRRGDRAAILHNLGVAANQESDFPRARRYFAEAGRQLERMGERRNLIKISTNLALIAAKLGDAEEARAHLNRADLLLRHYPDRRLECFLAYSRGTVSLWLGDLDASVEALEKAAELAAELGDSSLLGFARLHAAEACCFSGRYSRSLRFLRTLERSAKRLEPGVLQRMLLSRRLLVETILGRERLRRRTLEALEKAPRSGVEFLEAWNDLFHGASKLLAGEPAAALLEEALESFRRIGVRGGEGLAHLALAVLRLGAGDAAAVKEAWRGLEEACRRNGEWQRFLAVACPLAAAEARLSLGEAPAAEKWLAVASGAIVGTSFLELDCRLELLRVRLAAKKGDLKEARRHLHRSLHTRDLLLQFVPAPARQNFLSHRRFQPLREMLNRLRLPRTPSLSTETRGASRVYEGMVGRSQAMVSLFEEIERLRDLEVPVFITGETGTGKELVARALHARSVRRDGPYRAVHCACLPAELFESELFGHEAGAFTGAEKAQPGLLEETEGGTLLLDEIGQLPAESQAKLLKVLEGGAFRRLGSAASRRADVRFLAASSLDLKQAAGAGVFRADLYYRLAGVALRVPPLRERREDIPLLAQCFLEKHAAALDSSVSRLDGDALALLATQEWPGNVRELETLLLRALLHFSHPQVIRASDLEPLLAGVPAPPPLGEELLGRGLEEWKVDLERDYLKQLFFNVRGDLREMMRRLGVKSTKLYKWLRELGLDIRKLRRQL